MTGPRYLTLVSVVFALGVVASAEGEPRQTLLPTGECDSLYWDLTGRFESGDRLYARVLVTNEGPGRHTAAASGHWLAPDGGTTPFQNGRRRGRWEPSAGGRRIRIGSTLLDRSGDALHFEVDNDKRGVKLFLDVAVLAADELPVRDPPYAVVLERLAADATGSAWRRGMESPQPLRGWLSVVRTRSLGCESDLARRRIELHQLGAADAGYLAHTTGPSGERWAFLATRNAEARIEATSAIAVSLAFGPGPQGAYPVPVSLAWVGAAEGEIELESPHLAVNPLAALPRLMQMLYSFRARPHRIWTDARVAIRLKAGSGRAVPSIGTPTLATITYLDPPGAIDVSPPPDSGG